MPKGTVNKQGQTFFVCLRCFLFFFFPCLPGAPQKKLLVVTETLSLCVYHGLKRTEFKTSLLFSEEKMGFINSSQICLTHFLFDFLWSPPSTCMYRQRAQNRNFWPECPCFKMNRAASTNKNLTANKSLPYKYSGEKVQVLKQSGQVILAPFSELIHKPLFFHSLLGSTDYSQHYQCCSVEKILSSFACPLILKKTNRLIRFFKLLICNSFMMLICL